MYIPLTVTSFLHKLCSIGVIGFSFHRIMFTRKKTRSSFGPDGRRVDGSSAPRRKYVARNGSGFSSSRPDNTGGGGAKGMGKIQSSSEKATMIKQTKTKSSPRICSPSPSTVANMPKKEDLKPVYSVGENVYAAWWEDKGRKGSPTWHPGIVKACKEVVTTDGQYGPTRFYDVEFDDGDVLKDIEDSFVFSHYDYLLIENDEDKTDWIGVKNIVDKESSDDWASMVSLLNACMCIVLRLVFSVLY